jgi:hypothetical protein
MRDALQYKLPSDYDLQVALLERRIGDEEDPLTVSGIRSELSLRFERLNNHSNNENGEASDEIALYSGQFKGKCRNCGKTVEMQVEVFIALNVASRDM